MNHSSKASSSSRLPPVAIFGASRGVGRALVSQAVAAGHPVTAVARNGAELRTEFPRIRVLDGDARDRAVVGMALSPDSVVFCALGAAAMSSSRIRSEGTAAIMDGMRRAGLKRLIVLSVLGARESRQHLPFFLRRVVFPFYLRRAVADHERQERLLASSDLNWTAVRPPTLVEGAAKARYLHGFGSNWSGISLKISREDVAHFMLQTSVDNSYQQQCVGVSDGK